MPETIPADTPAPAIEIDDDGSVTQGDETYGNGS